MQSKVRQALVDEFLSALQEDTIPWHRCWNTARPRSLQTGREYRGINNLSLSYIAVEKGFTDPRWLTFRQAKENGWHVNKGEKAARVEFWHYYDKETRKDLEPEEIRRIQREEPERIKDIRLSAFTYAVFNAQQVEGVPELKQNGPRADISFLKASRDVFLANLGVGFREGGDRAFYQSGTDCIVLPRAEDFSGEYAYVCTLLHEAGHSTGHPSRLDRPMDAPFGSPEYAKEELRAEIASAFTAQALGLKLDEKELKDSIDRHKAYIQSWISTLEQNPNELFAAIKDADKITDYLVQQGKVLELGLAADLAQAQASAEQPHREEGTEWEP